MTDKDIVEEDINEDEENESVNITALRSNKNFRGDKGKQLTKEEKNELKEKEKVISHGNNCGSISHSIHVSHS